MEKIRLHNQHLPILVVDDGSGALSACLFRHWHSSWLSGFDPSKESGKGAAIKTALTEVLTNQPAVEFMVTIDSDGQHEYRYDGLLSKGPSPSRQYYLGTRSLAKKCPLRSKFGNILTRNILRLATGLAIEDSQTGLRVSLGNWRQICWRSQVSALNMKRGCWSKPRNGVADSLATDRHHLYWRKCLFHFRSWQIPSLSIASFWSICFHLWSPFCRCDRLCVIDPFLVCHRSVLHRDRFVGCPLDFGDRQLLHQSRACFWSTDKEQYAAVFLLVIIQILLSSFLVYLIYLILPIGDSVLLKIGVDCLLFSLVTMCKNVIFKEWLRWNKNVCLGRKSRLLSGVCLSLIYLSWRGCIHCHGTSLGLPCCLVCCFGAVRSYRTLQVCCWFGTKSKAFEKPIVPEADYPAIDVLIATIMKKCRFY